MHVLAAQTCLIRSSPSPKWAHYIGERLRRFSATANRQRKNTKSQLPKTPARTRFAPSPTGYLHLGGLRTALFSYLLAKKTNGQFLLRLEDTDRKRTVDGAEERLYQDLRWAGLEWDEGPEVGGPHGPYRQSDRTELYRHAANDLLATPHAYRCFCSAERLDTLARQRKELGLPTDYDRTCASLSVAESEERAARGEAHVVRLRAPDTYPIFTDLVYGQVGKDASDSKIGAPSINTGVTHKHGEIAYEDPVLLKSDGRPTYHLANVVDDHAMQITHVVRATEWISSTPKHLALYEAFGWQPPRFAHVGLLVDGNGQKLSKRSASTGDLPTIVHEYRDLGILPETLLNFSALLGWSHSCKSDIMDLDKLVREFGLNFTRGNATVTADKLWYLQRAHAERAVATDAAALSTFQAIPPSQTPAAVAGDSLTAMASALVAVIDAQHLDAVFTGPQTHTLLDHAKAVLRIDARNYATPAAFWLRNKSFFIPASSPAFTSIPLPPPPHDTDPLAPPLATILDTIWTRVLHATYARDPASFKAENIEPTLAAPADAPDKQTRKAFHRALCRYLRWALLRGNDGPGVAPTMEVLGWEECVRRVRLVHPEVEFGA